MRSLGIACLLTLMAASAAHAADVGVFPVQGTNLNEGEMAAIGQLIASAYAMQSHRPVLGPQELADSLQRTASERDSAREIGLKEYIHVEAIHLTTRISLYVSLHNQHGSTLYELRDTAYSLDDMPVLSERIALRAAAHCSFQATFSASRPVSNMTNDLKG